MKILNYYKYSGFLLFLIILDCAIGGGIGVWREYYWSSLSNVNLKAWTSLIGIFSALALISCWVSGYSQYLINILSLSLRTKLTKKALKSKSYLTAEGGQQRVQEDCLSYPSLMLSLGSGLIRSIIILIIFSVLIVKQIGALYLIFPLVYAILGTLIAGKIAVPLISLNYLNQVKEAAFRQVLTKLNYILVHRNNFNLFKRTKYLQYFQSFFNQITIIVPHLILAIPYFSLKISFGVFMQAAAAIAELINSLSFLLNSFSDINRLISCRKRLKELEVI